MPSANFGINSGSQHRLDFASHIVHHHETDKEETNKWHFPIPLSLPNKLMVEEEGTQFRGEEESGGQCESPPIWQIDVFREGYKLTERHDLLLMKMMVNWGTKQTQGEGDWQIGVNHSKIWTSLPR
jgi:hypothetical protein